METCTCHNHPTIQVNAAKYDPSRTLGLQNTFARELRRRFINLEKVIIQAVVTQDCFGLNNKMTVHKSKATPPGDKAFAFSRSSDKLVEFEKWLQRQIDNEILEVTEMSRVGQGIEGAWTNKYITDSYKRGIIRSRYEMQKAGLPVPSVETSGGINVILGSTPMHLDRVGLLYTRVFSDLKGITAAMDTQISRVLAQGIADGDNPRLLARKLLSTINGTGMGDLSLTDTLGRFVPARTRAEMLARTEIIRAHHMAQVQEYRNWKVLGVTVEVEWKAGLDNRVCPICKKLDGRIFTLDEIEPMIPAHPRCFTDPQTPIYTSEGWKPIGLIKVGDSVLTHKKRFRKVYGLPRSRANNTEVVTFVFHGGRKISLTANHPILVTKEGLGMSRWKPAGQCTTDDLFVILGNECKRCEKTIPYFNKYCSLSCKSKDNAERQWADPKHRQNMSLKISAKNKEQYANGERDRFATTRNANKATKELARQGKLSLQRPEVKANNKLKTNLPHHIKASSERMLANNPMKDPIVVEKMRQSLLALYIQHPEMRLNARLAKHRKDDSKRTWIEQRMGDLLDKLGIEYIFQYPILNYNVDFAIPALKIVIECDGEHWHQDKEKDAIRQKRIENEGWFVLRYSGKKINECLGEVEQEVSRVVCNHTGEYKLSTVKIYSINKWIQTRKRTLFNLSVEEDESYIAKGIVVHNCRCSIVPHIVKEEKKIKDKVKIIK